MSALKAILNGQPIAAAEPALWLDERGFQYGDGLFETMALSTGRIALLEDHWQRLNLGCQRLQLPPPERETWLQQLQQLIQGETSGVVKYMLTRGRGARGYRPAVESTTTQLWQLFAPVTLPSVESMQNGIRVRWCQTRLARHAWLAGIKHCNRLEQVLAQNEWHDATIAEGLLLDTEGELICGTMSNVFLRIEERWITPDLRYCGVAGVARAALLRWMTEEGWAWEQRAVHPEEVADASEWFVCNAVRGIRPVTALDEQHWPVGAGTRQLCQVWSSWQ